MKYFDLHCDTLYEIYKRGETLSENSCHVSYAAASCFDRYTQVLALWTQNDLSADEAFDQYGKMLKYFRRTYVPRPGFYYRLAVEGGKLIGRDLSRLERMKDDGIELLTLVWGGDCEIGGAHDSGAGLTGFGKEAVNKCIDLGIMPDLSHASDRLFFDTVKILEKRGVPAVATHSDSRSVREHTRNLTDDMFRIIRDSGGICGISLCPDHLSDGVCDADSVLRHIEKYLELGGEDTVCMGCDFDGVSALPEGISSARDIPKLRAQMIGHGYSKELCDKIFFQNAERFFDRYLPSNGAENICK